MSNHISPSVPYSRIPLNRSPIFAAWPACGPTAVSDSSSGLPVRIRTWVIVLPNTLLNVSDGR